MLDSLVVRLDAVKRLVLKKRLETLGVGSEDHGLDLEDVEEAVR